MEGIMKNSPRCETTLLNKIQMNASFDTFYAVLFENLRYLWTHFNTIKSVALRTFCIRFFDDCSVQQAFGNQQIPWLNERVNIILYELKSLLWYSPRWVGRVEFCTLINCLYCADFVVINWILELVTDPRFTNNLHVIDVTTNLDHEIGCDPGLYATNVPFPII